MDMPTPTVLAPSAGTAEYTNCISAEGENSTNECPGYDTKQSDGKTSVMLEFRGIQSTPFIAIAPTYTLARSSSIW